MLNGTADIYSISFITVADDDKNSTIVLNALRPLGQIL